MIQIKSWLKISAILSMFGFLKEIRPSEPYIYEFLIDKRWRNISDAEVNQQVYPVGTYSYLVLLIVGFLITDLCRYKPLITVCGLSGIVVWSLLLWTKTLFELQVLEVMYGIFMATEVAYYTYIYAKVDKENYQKVTSHTRAAILAGRSISSAIAQILVSFDLMNYRDLNYITFAALIVATLWTLLLPSVDHSIYFHQEGSSMSLAEKTKNAFTIMKTHFVQSFSNKHTVLWSLWWSLSTCGFIQCQTYMQPLWSKIQKENLSENEDLYNGAVEAVLTVLGFLGALLAGYIKYDWDKKGYLFLSVCSLLQGGILILSSQTKIVWISYVCYIVFGMLYHFVVTVSSAQIAKNLSDDIYGLVFGIDTFVALVFQTILTTVFVSKNGFEFGIRDQFLTYGIYHVIIALIFLVTGVILFLQNRRK